MTVIETAGLVKQFGIRRSPWRFDRTTVLAGIDLEVGRGETLGLVGESGCGKSTLGRCLLRLMPVDGGSIRFQGRPIETLSGSRMSRLRPELQMVFQDPLGSFNPALTVQATLAGSVRLRDRLRGRNLSDRVSELLADVGLDPRFLDRYPYQMSGGQLQRVGIARALATRPTFVFLDEPTSALDLSIRGQIVNLLCDLQDRLGLSYLYVSHDLGVVRHIAARIAVMYLGRIVESGTRDQVFGEPIHPYTRGLMAAAYETAADGKRIIRGELSSDAAGVGCAVAPRCVWSGTRCREQEPPAVDVGSGHEVRCWLVDPGGVSARTDESR